MSDTIQTALTAIELRESELLAWGAVGAEWRHDELRELLAEYGDAGAILDEMCDKALVVETPTGGYRSRSAETVRLLATLRQSFRQEAILHGRPLVLDYRFLQRPRRRPRRDIPADEFISDMSGIGRFGVSSLREVIAAKDFCVSVAFHAFHTRGARCF